MLFVSPDVQAAGIGRALLAQVMPPGGTAGDAADDDGDRDGRASRSRTPSTPRYGIVPRIPLLEPRRAGPSGRTRSSRCRRASRPSRSSRSPAGRRTGPAIASWPTPSTRSTARCWASPIRTTTATCARNRGAAGSTAAPTAPPLGYGYATEAGRVGPVAVRDADLLVAGPRPPDHGRRSRAARSRCGCRGVPIARSWPRCGPGSASTSSRSCCAGTARSPTSARYLPISPGLL